MAKRQLVLSQLSYHAGKTTASVHLAHLLIRFFPNRFTAYLMRRRRGASQCTMHSTLDSVDTKKAGRKLYANLPPGESNHRSYDVHRDQP